MQNGAVVRRKSGLRSWYGRRGEGEVRKKAWISMAGKQPFVTEACRIGRTVLERRKAVDNGNHCGTTGTGM